MTESVIGFQSESSPSVMPRGGGWGLGLAQIVLLMLTACGTMATPPKSEPVMPRAGLWTLSYTGECKGREAETLRLTRVDERVIVFDEFELARNEAGDYVGSAIFIAPMPVDGRDIPYEISFALSAASDGSLTGTETVVEGRGARAGLPG